jgi:hypothetical protein
MMRMLLPLLAYFPVVASAGDLWGVASVTSYHFNRSADLNENNLGLGAEFSLDDNTRVIGGAYKNSFSKTSVYGGVALVSDQWKGFRLALSFGFITGYYDLPVFLLPSLIWEGDRFGINLIPFPKCNTCSASASAGIGLQLKAKVW